MSPSQSSRYFIMARYAMLFVINCIAIFFAVSNEIYFTVSIFSTFAAISCLAIFCAWRHRISAELYLIKIMIIYIVVLLFLDIFHYKSIIPVSAAAFFIICVDVILFLIHRIIKLRWLIYEIKIYKERQGDIDDA